MAEQNETEQRLPDVFKEIWNIYDILEKAEESTNSDRIQGYVRHACELCKAAIEMVNKLCLFSNNEEIEEVATNEIKFMLLPALMGYFLMKNTIRGRLAVVKESQEFYTDYMKMCRTYTVTDRHLPTPLEETAEANEGTIATSQRPGMADLRHMANQRQNKIQVYREQKEMEKKLQDLREVVEGDNVDDEVKRDYYMTLLKRWVAISTDELDCIQCEIGILSMMAERKAKASKDTGKESRLKIEHKPPPLRPFIITKDLLQKQVYGLGYPSLPTVTIEEFAEQKIASGELQLPGATGHSMQSWANDPDKDKEDQEKEQAEKEEKQDHDDPETRWKAQEWDEYKDDHRRGWGNRQNMG